MAAMAAMTALPCRALEISSYYSPKNSKRPIRPRTDYIILHTTEGREKGSLAKLVANGECHFFVGVNGHVYRIVDRNRLAFHAGTSMWNGRVDIDNYAIGIEVCGYHYADLTPAQYKALRELLGYLQTIYRIPDDRVLTHSMVAYGEPNQWHKRPHRGRKRCGMLFAKASVREALGLDRKPTFDPDVKEGRLTVGDPYLAKVLYGSRIQQAVAITRYTAPTANVISKDRSAWDIAGDDYNSANTVYLFPNGKKIRGNKIKDWGSLPPGTRVITY